MAPEATSLRSRRALLLTGVAVVGIVGLSLAFLPFRGSGPDTDSFTVGGHPLYGQPAPEIDQETLDGERMTLSSLAGQPVLINFWATWCGPCREEFGLMVSAYSEHAQDGLQILGVVHDDTADRARAFAADEGATWPMVLDAADVAWDDYGGLAMPTSFFVDTEGIVRAFSLGGFTEEGLARQLETILPQA